MNLNLQKWKLPRRTFLRGLGATLGLPMMNAMGIKDPFLQPQAEASQKPADPAIPPRRLACIYFPNGVWEKDWHPTSGDGGLVLPWALEPLRYFQDSINIFSGLDKKHSHQGDGHYAKTANFLTGLPVRKTTGKDLSVGGISIDQLCARELGHLTPLPSLELGIDPVISGIDTNVGFTRLYGSYISWRSESVPVAREINPLRGYEKLFGIIRSSQNRDLSSGPSGAWTRPRQGPLLDLVLEDASQLRSKLGRDDQFKLDEYLDSVREVEKRIDFFSNQDPREWRPSHPLHLEDIAAPKGAPGDHEEHVRLMLDLMVLGFWSDSTRISTFMFANDVSNKNFSELIPGVKGGHHSLSHHQDKEDAIAQYAAINRWHAAQLAYMLRRMQAIPEGERTLLDNSMVLFGSSFSDGNRHDPSNLPIIVAGNGGGTIKSGRHINCPDPTPLCNLYVSLLERMGVDVEAFGDSTQALPLV